jgi:RNA polymerase sigma factor (sigma-70 family)
MALDSGSSDSDLLAGTHREPEAFGLFYRRYERLVFLYLMRRTGDPEVAADLAAEIFAAALRNAGRYRPEAPTAAGWLLTIARHTLTSSRRRGRVEAHARRRLGIREAILLNDEDIERIEALCGLDGQSLAFLEELPTDQREAVRAHVLDERSYRDIAGELQTSELVIRKRVSRGLSTIRRQLEEPA